MTCYVYHICREQDKYNFAKGYIGISSDLEMRLYMHRSGYTSPVVKRANEKYNDIIYYVIVESSREYCLELESSLRPEERMGWNIAPGGGDPPSAKGKVMSQRQKDRISQSQSRTKSVSWKGWYLIDGVKYEIGKDVAEKYGITIKTVYDRVKNPKFPNWTFEPCESKNRK